MTKRKTACELAEVISPTMVQEQNFNPLGPREVMHVSVGSNFNIE